MILLTALPKDKICESSPIEMHVNPHGQWNLSQPKDSATLQPPLPGDSPLMLPPGGPEAGRHFSGEDSDDEERWLSQVEITTHVGPHRRLWMGPQFAFKTLEPAGGDQQGEVVRDLDVSLSKRPEQSHPVNMATQGRVPVSSKSFN